MKHLETTRAMVLTSIACLIGCGNVDRSALELKNSELTNRVRALEEENARLRATTDSQFKAGVKAIDLPAASKTKGGEANRAAIELGVEISNVKTYWKEMPGSFGGKKALVPHLRFTIKNVGDAPITHITARAEFELTGKQEVLGRGSELVVWTSDPPLRPSYKKEVTILSATGYEVDFPIVKFPAVTAQLFIEKEFDGKKHLLRSISISPTIQD